MNSAPFQNHPTPLTDFIIYAKAGQSFHFLYDGTMASVNACMKQLTDFANDPELDFGWSDAATIARKLKERHA